MEKALASGLVSKEAFLNWLQLMKNFRPMARQPVITLNMLSLSPSMSGTAGSNWLRLIKK